MSSESKKQKPYAAHRSTMKTPKKKIQTKQFPMVSTRSGYKTNVSFKEREILLNLGWEDAE